MPVPDLCLDRSASQSFTHPARLVGVVEHVLVECLSVGGHLLEQRDEVLHVAVDAHVQQTRVLVVLVLVQAVPLVLVVGDIALGNWDGCSDHVSDFILDFIKFRSVKNI